MLMNKDLRRHWKVTMQMIEEDYLIFVLQCYYSQLQPNQLRWLK